MFMVVVKKNAPNLAYACACICALNIETGILAMDKELFGNGGSPL